MSCADNRCFFIKENSEVQIDLSAVAKGYAVDVISAYLDSAGVHDYLVEIGGELRFKGTNEIGQHWRVGIANPDTNLSNQEPFMVLSGLEMALATSGIKQKVVVSSLPLWPPASKPSATTASTPAS